MTETLPLGRRPLPRLSFPSAGPSAALAAALLLALPARAQDAPAPPTPAPEPEKPPAWSLIEADPALSGVIVHDQRAFDGTTLIWPLNDQAAYLLDMEGKVLHTWPLDSAPGAGACLLSDGSLLRAGREDRDPKFKGGGIGGRIQRVAPDGTLLWSWSLADELRCQHHDIEPLPNGNVLIIAWERKTAAEAVARGRDPEHVGKAGLWPDMVLEVKPLPPDGAEIVWEWHAWDHLIQDLDAKRPGFGAIPSDPGRIDINFDHRHAPAPTAAELKERRELEEQMADLGYAGGDKGEEPPEDESPWETSGDWLHTNAASYLPAEDLIVLSSPKLSELLVIDHSTTTAEAATASGGRRGRGGRILWRYGNPANHGHGAKADRKLFAQHNPTWVAGKGGAELRLLVFSNGTFDEERRFSSVEEVVVPFDPARGFARTAAGAPAPPQPAWSYSDPERFYSGFISGAQRLPNGNTLVCSGAPGRVFEVTPGGEIVWDYRNRLGGSIAPPEHAGKAPPTALFRATRLAPDHPGVKALLQ